jgi:predicted RNase H-like HicB family nuclease
VTEDALYYWQQPYKRIWETREEDGERYFVVRIAEFPAVAGDGLSREEALSCLREAFDDFIAWRLEDGLDIPKPSHAQVQDDEPEDYQVVAVGPGDRPGGLVTVRLNPGEMEALAALAETLGLTLSGTLRLGLRCLTEPPR